jgi:hypothetical protein
MNDVDGVAVSLEVTDLEGDGVVVALGDRVALLEADGDSAGDSLSEGVKEMVGVTDEVSDIVGVLVIDLVFVRLADRVAEMPV